MAKPQVIKVCLVNRGEDAETPWAQDLGPAKGPKGSRKVRLVNVPFMHEKPTWGDVIVVSPVEDGPLTWDSNNVPASKIGTRILEDGGRHAMIVHYIPRTGDATGNAAFKALDAACKQLDIVCEGALGPGANRPGIAYLAIPSALTASAVMTRLRDAAIPAGLIQIYPRPRAKAKAKSKPKPKPKPKPRKRST
jgi:hypothetical protein